MKKEKKLLVEINGVENTDFFQLIRRPYRLGIPTFT